jgi:hypothetical protein
VRSNSSEVLDFFCAGAKRPGVPSRPSCHSRIGGLIDTEPHSEAIHAPHAEIGAIRPSRRLPLGGHLKTSHRWPLQNRPTEPTQGHLYLYTAGARGARIFWHGNSERLILTSPGRRIRQRRDATGAPSSGRNGEAVRAVPVRSHSGGKAVNPGSARAAPSHQESQLSLGTNRLEPPLRTDFHFANSA